MAQSAPAGQAYGGKHGLEPPTPVSWEPSRLFVPVMHNQRAVRNCAKQFMTFSMLNASTVCQRFGVNYDALGIRSLGLEYIQDCMLHVHKTAGENALDLLNDWYEFHQCQYSLGFMQMQ